MTRLRWVVVVLAFLAGIAASVPVLALPHTYGYDLRHDAGTSETDGSKGTTADLGRRGSAAAPRSDLCCYDDRSQLARASARLGGQGLAPKTAGLASLKTYDYHPFGGPRTFKVAFPDANLEVLLQYGSDDRIARMILKTLQRLK